MGVPRERRLISEWAKDRHPNDHVFFNQPVGVISEEELEAIDLTKGLARMRSWRLKADAVVVTKTTLRLVEAKITSVKNGIGDLHLYRIVLPDTPELQPYLPRTIERVLVVPWATAYVLDLCERDGVIVDIFNPLWVAEFMAEHGKYYTRQYQRERDERKRILAALDLA